MTLAWPRPFSVCGLIPLLAYQALGKPFQPTSLIAAQPSSRCNCIGFTTLMRLYRLNRTIASQSTSPSPRWRRWMHGVRQVIESVSGKLHLAFRLATDRLHTVPGFRARLAAKVGLHNFCCWLNLLL